MSKFDFDGFGWDGRVIIDENLEVNIKDTDFSMDYFLP